MYRICPDCGAYNDPGERCDCQKNPSVITDIKKATPCSSRSQIQRPKCVRCHRALTDPESVSRGYGPVCWGAVNPGLPTRSKSTQSKPAPRSSGRKAKQRPIIRCNDNRLRTRSAAGESNYDYKINCAGKRVLVITDLDMGGKSVTNNIEAILRQIATDEGLNPKEVPIIYRDSMGQFDGVAVNDRGKASFFPLGSEARIVNESEALRAVRRLGN